VKSQIIWYMPMYFKIYVQLSLDITHEYIFVSISKKHNLTSHLIYSFKLVNIYAGGSYMEARNASRETLATEVPAGCSTGRSL